MCEGHPSLQKKTLDAPPQLHGFLVDHFKNVDQHVDLNDCVLKMLWRTRAMF
jgi:hypothetical protein